jgi:hypothetical protein
VALLVFLSATAGARIVAADFIAAYNLLHGIRHARSSHARLLQFTSLLPLKLFFDVVERSLLTTCGRRRWLMAVA